jgi:CDP-diacylglycerol--serine O-phosphatidyltransferase
MMSHFRYWSFKDINPGRRVRFAQLLAIPLVIIVIALAPPLVIFGIAGAYALSGPARWFWIWRQQSTAERST